MPRLSSALIRPSYALQSYAFGLLSTLDQERSMRTPAKPAALAASSARLSFVKWIFTLIPASRSPLPDGAGINGADGSSVKAVELSAYTSSKMMASTGPFSGASPARMPIVVMGRWTVPLLAPPHQPVGPSDETPW